MVFVESTIKFFGTGGKSVAEIPSKIKEWAYAGFGFDFIAATVSLIAVDGPVGLSFFPLAFLVILAISYIYKEKLAK